MSSQRNRQLRDIVDGLAGPEAPRPLPTLRPEEPRGGIPTRRGYFEHNHQPGSGEGGTAGIASPLVEGDAPAIEPVIEREYYPPTRITSSDGLFVMDVEYPKSIKFRDAAGSLVEIRLANPLGD